MFNNTTRSDTTEPFGLPLWCFVFLCVVALVGSVGNAFIIGAVCLQKRLRVRGNAFIINLAVADLIITAYIMPVGLTSSRFKEPPFGGSLCDVNGFLIMCSCGVSTQSLMLVAIERYMTICKMHWYRRVFTVKMIAIYIALVWMYTAVWTAQGWTGWTEYIYGNSTFLCLFNGPVSLSYDICLVVFGMALPMFVLIFSYVNVFRVVWKSRLALAAHHKKSKTAENSNQSSNIFSSEQRRMKREVRLAMTLFAIVVTFALFWIPAAIVLPMTALWSGMPKLLYTTSVWIALSNSSVNSIIYGAMNYNFRQGYRLFYTKLFCLKSCSRRQQPGDSSSCGNQSISSASTSKGTSPETSLTQTGTTRRCPTGKRSHANSVKDKSESESTAKDNINGEENVTAAPETKLNMGLNDIRNLAHAHSGFVQYVHLEGEGIDCYSSPILGATMIMSNGVTETQL